MPQNGNCFSEQIPVHLLNFLHFLLLVHCAGAHVFGLQNMHASGGTILNVSCRNPCLPWPLAPRCFLHPATGYIILSSGASLCVGVLGMVVYVLGLLRAKSWVL